MRHRDMYGQPGYLIRRLHQRSTALFAETASGHDITQIQLSILLVIADYPGIDATRISPLISSDRATIGQALIRLERKRLIRRRAGTRDKRTKHLVITPLGEEVVEVLSPTLPALGDAILNGLSERERGDLMRLIRKVITTTEGEAAIGGPAEECRRHAATG